MKSAVPAPFQLAPSSSTMTRLPRRALRCITSSADQTLPRSMPGSASMLRQGALEAGAGRLRAGRQDHLVGAEGLDVVGSNSVLSRTLTCSFVSWRSYQSRKSRIWPRRGCRPARRNWPPSSVGGFDQRHADGRARRQPAPLRARRRRRRPPARSSGRAAGVKRSPPHSNSRPAEGLIRQEIQ